MAGTVKVSAPSRSNAMMLTFKPGDISRAFKFSADDYGWVDILLQLANAIFRTTWFTGHLTFGKEKEESIAPVDIYNFAEKNPSIYNVTKLDIQDFKPPV